jgi:hypothetical protein
MSPTYFLLGRWVSADVAANLVALLDFGSRVTLGTAVAAFLLAHFRFCGWGSFKPLYDAETAFKTV